LITDGGDSSNVKRSKDGSGSPYVHEEASATVDYWF